ncbi:heterokaryon incompatibility protein-domain-containing protein [Triangularia verruculosa]|uniref:Heterokaryon incompatibility protein-domain-containing protein n=1 Tax=Triangularia verruculosa TaxID=2587418 RepID=A0AAN6XCI1_9PEZI|nr:heterokaryon incompatibility protein-domain-containing protein [Triangularia verruculosa]
MYRSQNRFARKRQDALVEPARVQRAREAPYQYDQLPDPRSIRLLKLPRVFFTGCLLETYSLDDAPEYMALSYTWGSPIIGVDEDEYSGAPIPLGIRTSSGKKFIFIGRNLYEALVSIIARGLATYLWVDAVCINQSDNDEKGIQIALMGDIFSRCQKVIAWLGLDDTDFDNVKTLLARFGTPAFHEYFQQPEAMYSRNWSEAVLAAEFGVHVEEALWRSYISFLERRRWFSRVWIVQEIALPPEIHMLCGLNETDWACISYLAEFLQTGFGSELLFAVMIGRAQRVFKTSGLMKSQDYFQSSTPLVERTGTQTVQQLQYAFLEQCLMIIKALEVTDLRDRVYGALGIFTKFHIGDLDPLLVPDYTLPAPEIFTRVAWLFILELPHLSTLPTWKKQPTLPGLPSWVPDYSSTAADLSALIWFQKPNASRTDPRAPAYRERNGSELYLDGAAFDSVVNTAGIPFTALIPGLGHDDQRRRRLQQLDCALRLCLCPPLHRKEGETVYETLFLTLVVGITKLGPAPPIPTRSLRNFIKTVLADSIRAGDTSDASFQGCLAGLKLSETSTSMQAGSGKEQFPTVADIEQTVLAQERREMNDDIVDGEAAYFIHLVALLNVGRRLYRTTRGYLGLGPATIRPGDQVWMIRGAIVPIVLREADEVGKFTVVGDSYLHGFMNGEMLDCSHVKDKVGRVTLI